MFEGLFITGILAEVITLETAIYINSRGYTVTVDSGRVLIEKEKATGETAR